MKYLLIVLMMTVVLFSPLQVALAGVNDTSDGCPVGQVSSGGANCAPATAQGLIAVINKIFTTAFVLLVTLASFVLLYAAFLYITSEGEQEKVANAKKLIVYVVIALIIAALAWGAPRAIQSFIA